MENNEIKIGRSTFSKDELSKLTLKKALSKYDYIDNRIVSKAWKQANPEDKKPSVSKNKSKPKKMEKIEEQLPKEKEKDSEETEHID
tara:strand:+ start:79 stop:339 length:261 start_codon:yes stop_codon:yes gene_type:complete